MIGRRLAAAIKGFHKQMLGWSKIELKKITIQQHVA